MPTALELTLYTVFSLVFILFVLWIINLFSSNSWFCYKMDWHKEPWNQSFDGFNQAGKCPRCKKEVLKDSQGNWFRSHND